MHRPITALLLTLAAAAILAACGGEDDNLQDATTLEELPAPPNKTDARKFDPSSRMGEVQVRGELRAVVHGDRPPLGRIGEDGGARGFEVALAKLVAAELGVGFAPEPLAERAPAEALGDGADLVLASVEMDPELLSSVALTEAYLITPRGRPFGAATPEGDRRWNDFVDDVLEEAKRNGTWARLYSRFLERGTKPTPEPPLLSREEAYELAQE